MRFKQYTFFFIETKIALVIHGFLSNFFCLRENFLIGACLSIICKTIRVNSLNITSKLLLVVLGNFIK